MFFLFSVYRYHKTEIKALEGLHSHLETWLEESTSQYSEITEWIQFFTTMEHTSAYLFRTSKNSLLTEYTFPILHVLNIKLLPLSQKFLLLLQLQRCENLHSYVLSLTWFSYTWLLLSGMPMTSKFSIPQLNSKAHTLLDQSISITWLFPLYFRTLGHWSSHNHHLGALCW
jgi:hypothetical protein